jgi:hypothetical protein
MPLSIPTYLSYNSCRKLLAVFPSLCSSATSSAKKTLKHSVFSPECYLEQAGLYRGCDTILVTNLGPNHEANSFFIAKRNFESLFDESQGSVTNVFET